MRKNELKIYSTTNFNKIDKLVNSNEKKIISKDTKGSASEYELSVFTYFSIGGLGTEQKFLLKETQNLKNISDKFELRKSEEILVQNLTEKFIQEIISSILSLNNDN